MNFKKSFQPDYMHYSAQEFAKDNDILYIPTRSCELKVPEHEKRDANSLLLANDRCIILHPPNDGMPTCPVEFYRKAKNDRYVKVMDNKRAFSEITNLPEILLQMTCLYEEHINNRVFLDPMSFAVMLIDPIKKRYHGRGKLAITNDTLCNNKVKPKNQDDARKYFYNKFLDHFIGWNFGKAVSENDSLKSALSRLVRLLDKTGLRADAGAGFDVWISKYVWHVKYADNGVSEIIYF